MTSSSCGSLPSTYRRSSGHNDSDSRGPTGRIHFPRRLSASTSNPATQCPSRFRELARQTIRVTNPTISDLYTYSIRYASDPSFDLPTVFADLLQSFRSRASWSGLPAPVFPFANEVLFRIFPTGASCRGESRAPSSSARNDRHGSGIFSEFGMGKVLCPHVRQQIPVLRFFRPVYAQPIPLHLRDRLVAERIFLHQPRTVQHARILLQPPRPRPIFMLLRNLLRHRGNEPQPVLQVVQLCVLHQPIPIHVRIPRRKPRQSLDDARIKIGFFQRVRQHFRRIVPRFASQIRKSRIAQCRKLVAHLVAIERLAQRFQPQRQRHRRRLQQPHRRPRQPRRQHAPPAFHHGKIRLRHAQPLRCLLLRPAFPFPRRFQLFARHLSPAFPASFPVFLSRPI